MSYNSRITGAFKNAPRLPLTADSRYVLISDCHRGNGTRNDNFMRNQNLYFAALRHYYENGFTYIELGDGDELWENRCMSQITEIHSNVFWLLNKYFEDNRLYMLYGNHDIVKRKHGFLSKNCHGYSYTSQEDFQPLFSVLQFHAGIILEDQLKQNDIYLTHGHQADLLNSVLWRLARFLVRYIWRPLEALAFNDPTSAAKNNTHKHKTEVRLTEWARKEHHILVCGHTHRPMLGTQESPYFNTGSCLHPRCITCIEITERCFYLVKWNVETRADRTLYISRSELAPPICIDDYF